MQFIRKLTTPVIATVLLIGGAAFAQDAVMETLIENDGTWQDAGLFHWRYNADTGEVEWGDIECTTETTEVSADSELEHFGSNCHTIDLTEPRNPIASDGDGEDPDEGDSSTEVNHGDVVSRAAHQVKQLDEEGAFDEEGEFEGENRGSIISQFARGAKDLFGGDDESEDVEDPEVEDESDDGEGGPPDHAKKDKEEKAPPEKAKGKGK